MFQVPYSILFITYALYMYSQQAGHAHAFQSTFFKISFSWAASQMRSIVHAVFIPPRLQQCSLLAQTTRVIEKEPP